MYCAAVHPRYSKTLVGEALKTLVGEASVKSSLNTDTLQRSRALVLTLTGTTTSPAEQRTCSKPISHLQSKTC